MNIKRFIGLSAVLAFLIVGVVIPDYAKAQSDPQAVFSLQPTKEDLEILNSQPKQPEPKAWFVDLNGNKTPTEVISKDELKGLAEHVDETQNADIKLQFVEDHGTYIYSYVWQYYTENYNSKDMYKFFQGSCSVENGTGSNMTLKYTQGETKQNTWIVTGKVEVEPEFGVKILAKLNVNAGVTVSKSSTTQSSTNIETTMTVRPGYRGVLSRYKQGEYSSGAGCWKKYKVIKATGEMTDLGYYYETGTAWGICNNIDNYKATETKLN
jgi:hypothetical protein